MKYYLSFDRWGHHTLIYDGDESGAIQCAIDLMYYPMQIGKRAPAFISHVSIWESDVWDAYLNDPDRHTKNFDRDNAKYKGVAIVEIGVIDNVRIGMLWDAWNTDKHWLLRRNGDKAHEIDRATYDRLNRIELNTRAKRVREIPESLPINVIPSCPICGGIE